MTTMQKPGKLGWQPGGFHSPVSHLGPLASAGPPDRLVDQLVVGLAGCYLSGLFPVQFLAAADYWFGLWNMSSSTHSGQVNAFES